MLRQIGRQRSHFPRHRQRLLQFAARLLEAHAQARLELFDRGVPEARIGARLAIVDAERPAVVAPQEIEQGAGSHPAVDREAFLLVLRHAVGEIVDEVAMRLEHQADQEFLTFEAQGLLGPAIERIPRPRQLQQSGIDARGEPLQIAGQVGDTRRLPAIPGDPG